MPKASGKVLLSGNFGKKVYRIYLALLSLSIKKKKKKGKKGRPHNTCYEKVLHFLQRSNTSSLVWRLSSDSKAFLQITT